MIRGTVSSRKGFYIGDPCYVLGDKIYYDFWGEKKKFSDGVFKFKNLYFAIGSTKYGDGCYGDDDGNEYPVDSGTIALIPLELVGKKDRLELGNVFEITGEAEFAYEDGMFEVTLPDSHEIRIDTNADEDEQEDIEDCDENCDDDYYEDCDEDCQSCEYYDDCEYREECEQRRFLEEYDSYDSYDGGYYDDDDFEE